ncbi:iron chelate uptake ABC transporter family permease subunit [Microbulbifer sp. 2205BS26-8]|uniref:iron chelate uptake ABC transporter family permease subunit n=1 Tax=Microbulbifer sp. 2205BS26-8 TaxID=3064386 RepID=UPI00273E0A05|nr:iron chelate uptake ABC transporter family permease subunit [Microbulbifer sp. 2205BS26-8]MDP5210818.1 iron chelate uptake ABC transporter family permease subunit [Microbulbifer sp. 2205BS26-8]
MIEPGELLHSQFLWYALGAGLLVALVSGPLGCFAVWRRMAYFGDTLAHSALLGVALGYVLHILPILAIGGTCCLLAILLVYLQRRQKLAVDTLLGILSHSMLALGIVTIGLFGIKTDLLSLLLGDLLAVNSPDLLLMSTTAVGILLLLCFLWEKLLAFTLHEELASVEGIPVERVRLALMLMLALLIAIAMKVVGVLLITALLIIPAAAAHKLSRTPEFMAMMASLIGCFAVVLGLLASILWNTPAGPAIVLAASLLFLVCQLWPTGTR